MSEHWFDRLARTVDDPAAFGLTRRRALQLAATTVVAASVAPRMAAPAVAQKPTGDPCGDCKAAVKANNLKRIAACGRQFSARFPFNPLAGLLGIGCGMESLYRKFEDDATCRRICEGIDPPGSQAPNDPNVTPVPVSNTGFPPAANGSGCPSGTHGCNDGSTCCYGSDICCGCIHPTAFMLCCIVEVGCVCCPQS
ncbi:MAG: hypothetical protein JWP17_3759 [Solirubrobacterales bacterium]|nr:hypothetical protein [Solirubrobacterales bacterium]